MGFQMFSGLDPSFSAMNCPLPQAFRALQVRAQAPAGRRHEAQMTESASAKKVRELKSFRRSP